MAALNYPTDTMQAATPKIADDDDYYDVTRLKRQYYDYLGAKAAEIAEGRESRHYYHCDQWTSDEIAKLNARKQPVVTSNRIVRKIDAIVGLTERLRQDPKAYARTPQHQAGADLSTAVLRYCLDANDWKSKSARIARMAAIDGLAGIEYDIELGDDQDPDLALHIVYGDTFFYDPRSFDEGFTDARYVGIAKWIDVEQAKELVPSKADEIDDLIELGSDLTTAADADREKIWINTNEKRVRLVDHWYIKGGKWRWCLYIGNTILLKGVSPFVDEKGKTFPRYRVFSASVDHDGDRYGFVRNLKSPQDEVNHRRSKALHLLNSNKIRADKGAVDDVEAARKEMARPDTFLETNPGLTLEQLDKEADFKGQLEMLQEAKNEIENFGPNPALIGQGLEDSSGRAISLLQQAGIAELGPYLTAYKNWKIRVYRDIWNIVQAHWKAERWIRVTDDANVAQFFQINKLQVDQFGHPAIVNDIGSLDVDIIIDEGPDAVNLQADSMMVLQSLGPQFAQQFPEIALELSSLPQSVKKPMLDKIKAAQNAPPKPDPKVLAIQAQAQLDAQAAQRDDQRKQQEMALAEQAAIRDEQRAQQQAVLDAQNRERETDAAIALKFKNAEADMEIERLKAQNKMAIDRDASLNKQKTDNENTQSETREKFGGDLADRAITAIENLGKGFERLAVAAEAPKRAIYNNGRIVGSEPVLTP